MRNGPVRLKSTPTPQLQSPIHKPIYCSWEWTCLTQFHAILNPHRWHTQYIIINWICACWYSRSGVCFRMLPTCQFWQFKATHSPYYYEHLYKEIRILANQDVLLKSLVHQACNSWAKKHQCTMCVPTGQLYMSDPRTSTSWLSLRSHAARYLPYNDITWTSWHLKSQGICLTACWGKQHNIKPMHHTPLICEGDLPLPALEHESFYFEHTSDIRHYTSPSWASYLASIKSTVECHYNAVLYSTISHTALWWLMQNVNRSVKSECQITNYIP